MDLKFLAAATVCGVTIVWAQRVGVPTDDLANLSVDELFRIQVTSAGRKAQQRSKAPAAVFVLTADDIRRSGATSIPEALQWVPGLTVLRIDGRYWTISARGSARLYSDKILVMIDGRSLYTPLFSGVMWESLDVPLDSIEQIEVIRGPGAVMWGPNAVNGVINIITKRARQTRGAEINAAAGNELRGSATVRWGASPNEKLSYRIWGKIEDRNPAFSSPGYYFPAYSTPGDKTPASLYSVQAPSPVEDLDAKTARLGFRMDLSASAKDELMVQGDVYAGVRNEFLAYPIVFPQSDYRLGTSRAAGGFLQARWTRTESAAQDSTLQVTYDRQDNHYAFLEGFINNFTADYQRRRQVGERNEVYWGAGFQQYWDDTNSSRFVSFQPAGAVDRAGDLVFRDEFQIIPNRVVVSAGMRVDYASYTHLEFQPSFRVLYTPSTRQSVWMAVSRAVRAPSRLDRDMHIDAGYRMVADTPVKIDVFGSTGMQSEIARSAEAGYRFQAGQRWSLDSSIFCTFYDKLRAFAVSPPQIAFGPQGLSVSAISSERNLGTGRSYGGESWLTWQLRPTWRLIPSYSYLNEVRWLPSSGSLSPMWMFNSAGSRHQGLMRSQFDLSSRFQLDLMARARSRDLAFDLPGSVLFDARLGWRPARDSEFSIVAQNLSGRPVLEAYSETAIPAIPLRRTFVIKWTQRF